MPRPFALLLLLAACHRDPAPTQTQTTPQPGTTTTTTSPREALAIRAATHVTLTEGAGPLIDGNAPPPPPGQAPYIHPALHGSCMGEPSACSEAGTVVRRAQTFDEATHALEALGFTVTVRAAGP